MDGRLEKVELISAEPRKHSIMFRIFGRREPQLTEDNLINRSFEKRQISMKQIQISNKLDPDCLTNEIWDFILMSNDIL
jgi:hypothetical protein